MSPVFSPISTFAALFVLMSAFGQAATVETKPTELILNDQEIAQIIRHGPWPPVQSSDPSNRVSGNRSAIAFGKILFFESRLSANGRISCGSCHDPKFGWTDGKARAGGLARLDRNTQSLFNVGGNRWFGWDGRNDSLWGHSIGPLIDPREMGLSPVEIASLIRRDEKLNAHYSRAFGASPASRSDLEVVVDIAKSLAAFQETIVSARTLFDEFRDALARKDLKAAQNYPVAAQRGAAIFMGRGNCNVCHLGPRFTNDEFDDAGVPYFTGPGQVDDGRHGGIRKLKSSKFNQLGRFNDASDRSTGWATRQVVQTHRTFGQFKVPSLRQLTRTGPYMHNGSLKTLQEVVDHYSNINLDRIHSDGALILRPLKLSKRESKDLEAFLRTLSTGLPNK